MTFDLEMRKMDNNKEVRIRQLEPLAPVGLNNLLIITSMSVQIQLPPGGGSCFLFLCV
jgi:hypothetical protein